MNEFYVRNVVEAALLAAGKPLQLAELGQLFDETTRPKVEDLQAALEALTADYANRGLEVKETAAGFRIQVRKEFSSEISRLWPERPAKYSRALLETLALIAYRQPITRAEIEAVRGVAVNPNIVKTVIERNWVRVVGHRDVPGRPELLGTTREFLDYFGLRSLDELPPLAEVKALGDYNMQLELPNAGAIGLEGKPEGEGGEGAAAAVAGLLTNESGGSEGAAEGAAAGETATAAAGDAADAQTATPEVESVMAEGASATEAVAQGDVAHDAASGDAQDVADATAGVHAHGAEGTAADVVASFHEGAAEHVAAEGNVAADAIAGSHEDAGDHGAADGEAESHPTHAVADTVASSHEGTAEGNAADAVADAHEDAGDHHGATDGDAAGSHATHAVADTAGAHDYSAEGVAATDAAHGMHDAVASARTDDDAEVDRTLSGGGHAPKHTAESNDAESTESNATNESLDALDDGSDDDADEDELSADGHESRELVAAPRDSDD